MRALKRSATAVRVVMDPEFADARVFAAAQKLQSAWRNKARRAKGRRFRAAFEQARRRRRRQIESKAALQLQRLWRGRMIRCVRMVMPTTLWRLTHVCCAAPPERPIGSVISSTMLSMCSE